MRAPSRGRGDLPPGARPRPLARARSFRGERRRAALRAPPVARAGRADPHPLRLRAAPRPSPARRRAGRDRRGGGRRLRPRHARAGLGHRPPVSPAGGQRGLERQGHRGDPLHPLGPAPEGRALHPLHRGMRALRAGGHDGAHRPAGSAPDPRRRAAVRGHAHPLRPRGGVQDPGGVRRGQARRARRPHRQGRPLALSRRAQRQGRQGRPARPQHAVLDRQIRLPRARSVRTRRGRPVLAQGVQAVLPLRGIPLAGALPAALRDRPGGGAALLRPAAGDRRAARLRQPRRPLRGRALHEALFPHRQGGRRSHRHRLRRAGRAPGEALPQARPLLWPHLAPPRDPVQQGFRDRERPHHRCRPGDLRARSRQPRPPFRHRRRERARHSSRRDAARHPEPHAHRRRHARERGGQPPVPLRSSPRATRRRSCCG